MSRVSVRAAIIAASCVVAMLFAGIFFLRGKGDVGPAALYRFPALAASPAPPAWSRLELRLDALWRLRTSEQSTASAITLPDTRSMVQPRSRVIYSNHFQLSGPIPAGARARIRIEGAVCKATVFLNKVLLGKGSWPDLPFEVEATRALKRTGANLLEIKVEDRRALKLENFFRPAPALKEGRIQSSTSLEVWKRAHLKGPVTLVLTGDPRIASTRITPSWRKRQVEIDVVLSNAAKESQQVELRAEIWRDRRLEAAQTKQSLSSKPGTSLIRLQIPMPRALPWGSPPHGQSVLYSLVLTLSQHKQVLDQTARPFGFRELWIEGDALKLNGQRIFFLTRRTVPDLHGEMEVDHLQATNRRHGFNTWHTHFGSARADFFELCDELGQYVIPGLICAGALEKMARDTPSSHNSDFMNGYLREWFSAFHDHPSIVIWGQEGFRNMFGEGKDPRLDRPVLEHDVRSLSGDMKKLFRIKEWIQTHKRGEEPGPAPLTPELLTASNPAFIGEIHNESSPADLPRLIKDFPGLAGGILEFSLDGIPPGLSLREMLARQSGMSFAAAAGKVLPRIRVKAGRHLCVLHNRYKGAPRYLSGSLIGPARAGHLSLKEAGPVKIWTQGEQGPVEKVVHVERLPYEGKRPVIDLDL